MVGADMVPRNYCDTWLCDHLDTHDRVFDTVLSYPADIQPLASLTLEAYTTGVRYGR